MQYPHRVFRYEYVYVIYWHSFGLVFIASSNYLQGQSSELDFAYKCFFVFNSFASILCHAVSHFASSTMTLYKDLLCGSTIGQNSYIHDNYTVPKLVFCKHKLYSILIANRKFSSLIWRVREK